jgi:integrase/recombinase XerD
MTRKFATCNTCIKSKGGIRLVELHILNETGMVVLLDDEMRIIKPVYDYLKFQRQRDRALNTIKANGRDLKIYWDFLKNEGY